MNLLKMALEDLADKEPAGVRKEHTVVMKGPLATIFAKALNLAYSKTDPVSGNPAIDEAPADPALVPTLPGGVIPPVGVQQIAQESVVGSTAFAQVAQAVALKEQAEKIAQAEQANLPGGAADTDLPVNVVYPFGTHAKGESEGDAEPVDVMAVVNELNDTGMPHEVVFVEGAMAPTDDAPLGGASYSMVEQGSRFVMEGYQIVVKMRRVKD